MEIPIITENIAKLELNYPTIDILPVEGTTYKLTPQNMQLTEDNTAYYFQDGDGNKIVFYKDGKYV